MLILTTNRYLLRKKKMPPKPIKFNFQKQKAYGKHIKKEHLLWFILWCLLSICLGNEQSKKKKKRGWLNGCTWLLIWIQQDFINITKKCLLDIVIADKSFDFI
jgi:hypothetical protein